MLKKVEISGSNVLADRAYGAKAIRTYILEQGASSVITPNTIPFIELSNKCNFTFFFSANQKTRVKTAIANRGVISAHNLHIACSFEDDNPNA